MVAAGGHLIGRKEPIGREEGIGSHGDHLHLPRRDRRARGEQIDGLGPAARTLDLLVPHAPIGQVDDGDAIVVNLNPFPLGVGADLGVEDLGDQYGSGGSGRGAEGISSAPATGSVIWPHRTSPVVGGFCHSVTDSSRRPRGDCLDQGSVTGRVGLLPPTEPYLRDRGPRAERPVATSLPSARLRFLSKGSGKRLLPAFTKQSTVLRKRTEGGIAYLTSRNGPGREVLVPPRPTRQGYRPRSHDKFDSL